MLPLLFVLASPPQPLVPEEPERHWYGWELALSDFGSTTVGVLGASTSSAPLGYLSLGGYLFVPPAIHLAHDHAGKAGLSFVLRGALPVVGAVAGYQLAERPTEPGAWFNFSGLGGAVAGFGVGMITAAVIDDGIVGWEDEKRAPPADSAFTWQPAVSPVRGGASAGVVGTF